MKPLILLTAMTVIGVIGIIGTIDESYAQTPLTLNPLPNTPVAKQGASLTIYINPPERPYWYISNGDGNISRESKLNAIGHVFIPERRLKIDTEFKVLPNSTETIGCTGEIISMKEFLAFQQPLFPSIENLTTPSNIVDTKDNITAIGLFWHIQESGIQYPCNTIDLQTYSKYPITTSKELIYTIYNQHDKKPYYFSPRQNLLEAQPIPLCTTETIDTTTLTLKGDTKMCYGKHGNNMIIVSLKLTGIYGATESITTPKHKVNLDANVVDTKEYLALLKQLYLPAI